MTLALIVLYMKGASWDHERGCLVDGKPMELIMEMPPIHVKPVLLAEVPGGVATLPVYWHADHLGRSGGVVRLQDGGPQATYVMSMELTMPTTGPGKDAAYWIRRMTALSLGAYG